MSFVSATVRNRCPATQMDIPVHRNTIRPPFCAQHTCSKEEAITRVRPRLVVRLVQPKSACCGSAHGLHHETMSLPLEVGTYSGALRLKAHTYERHNREPILFLDESRKLVTRRGCTSYDSRFGRAPRRDRHGRGSVTRADGAVRGDDDGPCHPASRRCRARSGEGLLMGAVPVRLHVTEAGSGSLPYPAALQSSGRIA